MPAAGACLSETLPAETAGIREALPVTANGIITAIHARSTCVLKHSGILVSIVSSSKYTIIGIIYYCILNYINNNRLIIMISMLASMLLK